jgi:hypothetical protein
MIFLFYRLSVRVSQQRAFHRLHSCWQGTAATKFNAPRCRRAKEADGIAILSYEYPKRTDESSTPRGMAALRVVGTSGA